MEIFEAIQNRRSIGVVKPDPVEPELIEKLLEAATWAPNHYHTEPWKFFVLTGDGRRPLGKTLAEIAKEMMQDPTTLENQVILQKQAEKPFRAPVLIAAAAVTGDHPKEVELENIAAVSAAIQNMLLAAYAVGLGAIWRTGEPAYHPKMKELFGLREKDHLLGFIYVGYPNMPAPKGKRTPFAQKTKWITNDQTY